jgi:hypothetical protein
MYLDPSISVEELLYRQHPVLEFKKNGKGFCSRIGPKRRFLIGIRETKMILTCMLPIDEFMESNGTKPEKDVEQCMNNGPYSLPCSYTKYLRFKYKSGKEIEEPYLMIESEDLKLEIGFEEASAVSQKRHLLWRFVEEKADQAPIDRETNRPSEYALAR